MSSPYERWRLPDFLTMVLTDSDEAAAAHVNAWRQKAELLADLKKKLSELLSDLTVAWDPSRSEAAQSFVSLIESMISIIDEGTTAASQTADGVKGITDALASAKESLLALSKQYNDRAVAAREFNNRVVPFLPDAVNAESVLVPGIGLDTIALQQHKDRLDEQARQIMLATDGQVNEAAARFRTLPSFKPVAAGEVYENPEPSTSGNPGSDRGRRGTVTSGRLATGPVFDPPPPSVPPVETAMNTDPLDGGAPVLASGPAGSVALGPPAVAHPPVIGSLPPQPQSTWETVPNTIGAGGTAARPRAGVPTDGIIEGTRPRGAATFPGAEGVPNSQSGGSRRSVPTSKAHPLSERSPEQLHTSARGWRDRSYEQYTSRRSRRAEDPDNPWTVKEGVPPILDAPEPVTEYDAGPGVIGLDR